MGEFSKDLGNKIFNDIYTHLDSKIHHRIVFKLEDFLSNEIIFSNWSPAAATNLQSRNT